MSVKSLDAQNETQAIPKAFMSVAVRVPCVSHPVGGLPIKGCLKLRAPTTFKEN